MTRECPHCEETFDADTERYTHLLAVHGDELSDAERAEAESAVGDLTFGDRLAHQGLLPALGHSNTAAALAGGAVGLVVFLVVFQLFTGGLTGLLGGGSGSVNYHKADAPVGTSVGKTAPDATLQTVNGSTVTIQGSEKPTVIFLMASWCSSCRIESSALQEVEEIYGDRVRIISVDVDPKRDSMADLRAFKQKYGGPWTHAMATSEFMKSYRVKALDTTYVLNQHGVIVYKDISPTDTKTLNDVLQNVTGLSASTNTANWGEYGSVHWHANFSVSIHGDRVNFSKERYMVRSQYVHLEGGDGTTIHKHATGVTLADFFDTVGWKLTNDCLSAANGTTYCTGDGGRLRILVDGNEVDNPDEYEIQNNDTIRVVYE